MDGSGTPDFESETCVYVATTICLSLSPRGRFDNFLYELFKGAPSARQCQAGSPDTCRGREPIERGMRDRSGHRHQDHERRAVGQLADSGAAAMSRPLGRKP
jgi:hypothetical protein